MALQGHPRSLILAPIDRACATSYWSSIVTLVLHLAPFQRYCRLPAENDPTHIPLEFWDVPFRVFRGAKTQSYNYYKFIHVITFGLIQHIRPPCINVMGRRTDRRTTYDSNTALCTTCIARQKCQVESRYSRCLRLNQFSFVSCLHPNLPVVPTFEHVSTCAEGRKFKL